MTESGLNNQMGRFVRVFSGMPEDDPLAGQISHTDPDARLALRLLDPDPFGSLENGLGSRLALPDHILGSSESGGVILFNLQGAGSNVAFGGSRESILRYTAANAAIGVDIAECSTLRLTQAAVVFPEALRWADASSIQTQRFSDSNGRLTGVDLKIKSAQPPTYGSLSGSRSLALSSAWRVHSEATTVQVTSGLRIEVSAKRARRPEELLAPLRHLQLLLSVSLRRPVMASEGSVQLLGASSPARLWDWKLFERAAHRNTPTQADSQPVFGLAAINGLSGLRRWVDLCDEHPGVVVHLRSYTHGFGTLESELRSVAAGIEYWVALHRGKKSAWAKLKVSNSQKKYAVPLRLAMKAGRPFSDLVDGGVAQWAEQFWAAYNSLKHDAGQQLDAEKLAIHTAAARFLLETTLLNHCANSQAPARAVLSHVDYVQLQGAIKSSRVYA